MDHQEHLDDLLTDRKSWPTLGHLPQLRPDGSWDCDATATSLPCFSPADVQSALRFAHEQQCHMLELRPTSPSILCRISVVQRRQSSVGDMEVSTSKLFWVRLPGSERADSIHTQRNYAHLATFSLGRILQDWGQGKPADFLQSRLTCLLSRVLINGKICFFAVLSPSSIRYDESLSTARFADRFKRALTHSNSALTHSRVVSRTETRVAPEREVIPNVRQEPSETPEANTERVSTMTKTRDAIFAQWKIAGWQSDSNPVVVLVPHFLNLHRDPRLSETLTYKFDIPLNQGGTKQGDVKRFIVGRKPHKDTPDPRPDVEVNAMGVLVSHCTIDLHLNTEPRSLDLVSRVTPSKVVLTPRVLPNDPKGTAKCFVNGVRCHSEGVVLKHNDRVGLGNAPCFFIFVCPGQEPQSGVEIFQQAEKELHDEEKRLHAAEFGVSSELLSKALCDVDSACQMLQDLGLDKMCSLVPKIVQDRETRKEMVLVQATLHRRLSPKEPSQGRVSPEASTRWWKFTEFAPRLESMQRIWTRYHQESPPKDPKDLLALLPGNNPFVHEESEIVLGEADIWLQALGNMIEMDCDCVVLDMTGKVRGKIAVSLAPLDKNGNEGPWNSEDEKESSDDMDPFVDDVKDLIGKIIRFNIRVKEFKPEQNTSPPEYSAVRLRYSLWKEETPFESASAQLKGGVARLGYRKKHAMRVTEEIAKYLSKGKVTFQLLGQLE